MDSSLVFGGAEECHSSESGWTMYIGSPVQGEEDDDIDPSGYDAHGEFDGLAEENHKANHHDANSDDSMASDASSGPSHREQPWKAGRGITEYYKGHDANVDGKHCSSHKSKKAGVKKNRHEKKNKEKDEAEVAAKGVKHFTQGSKVRKNLGCGKRN